MKSKPSIKNAFIFWIPVIILTIVSLTGAFRFSWATSLHGLGIRTDSVSYFWVARTIADGLGIGRLDGAGQFKPVTHWPPFYAIVLAGFDKVGIDVVVGARILGIVLIAMTLWLCGVLFFRLTGSWLASLAGFLLVFTSPIFTQTNLYAMSEPLYLALTLLGFILFDFYIRKHNRFVFLGLAMVSGLAFLTRYVGLAFIITIALALFLFSQGEWKRRFSTAAHYGLLACLPICCWAIRNIQVSGNAANRNIGFYPIHSDEFYKVYKTVYSWLSPIKSVFKASPEQFAFLVGCLDVGGALSIFRQRLSIQDETSVQSIPDFKLTCTLILYSIFYPAMVLGSRLFFDQTIPLTESRILIPLWISILGLVLAGLQWFWNLIIKQRYHQIVRIITASIYCLVFCTFVMMYNQKSSATYAQQFSEGSGLAQVGAASTTVLNLAGQIPEDYIIYTDNIEKLYYLTGRYSWQIVTMDDATQEKIRSDLALTGAAILLMDADTDQVSSYLEELPELSVSEVCNDVCLLMPES